MNIFQGTITALITPLSGDRIDFDSLKKLINLQIDAGIDGIVVGGSTGEGNSLSDDEYNALIEASCLQAGKKIPVIASISTVSTKSAINKIKEIRYFGARGLMCTVPHYIKPTQHGIIEHFKQIHDSSDLPIMIYVHPGRTGIDLKDETIIRLSKFDRIVAIKDAGDDINRPLRLLTEVKDGFSMLTGNDENRIAYSSHGGGGCVSVISNLWPKKCKQLQDFLNNSEFAKALEIQKTLMPVYKAVFAEPNPIGIKYAASALGLCSDEIRLPLTQALPDTVKNINNILVVV
jgi:4-hydroxy-tetrahydrodipicolinate synthase